MPLTNAKTTDLFEVSDKTAIAQDTVVNLQEEGIEGVDDLELVDIYFLKQLTDNLERPGGQINATSHQT